MVCHFKNFFCIVGWLIIVAHSRVELLFREWKSLVLTDRRMGRLDGNCALCAFCDCKSSKIFGNSQIFSLFSAFLAVFCGLFPLFPQILPPLTHFSKKDRRCRPIPATPIIKMIQMIQITLTIPITFLRLHAVDGKTAEQLPVAPEILLHAGNQQALPKRRGRLRK